MAVLKRPNKILGIYWPLWDNAGSAGRITNASAYAAGLNQINIFHATPDGGHLQGDGTFVFGYGGIVNAADCKTCQDRGERVVLVCGGQNAGYNISDRDKATQFVKSVKIIIADLGGHISGLCFNNFEANVGSSATEIVWICEQLAVVYGADFTFSFPPYPRLNEVPVDRAIVLAMGATNLNWWTGGQQYDGAQNTIVADTINTVNLLGGAANSHKVGIAVGANYGAGGSTALSSANWTTLTTAPNNYNLAGIEMWCAQTDASAGWSATSAFKTLIGAVPSEQPDGTTPPAPPPPPPPAIPGVAVLSAPVVDKPAGYGPLGVVNVSVKVTTTVAAISTTQMIISMRRQGETHGGGPYRDFFIEAGAAFPLGARTFNGSRTFLAEDLFGTWEVYGTWQDSAGVYHDGPSTFFEYSAAPVTPPPPPPPAPVANFTGTPRTGTGSTLVSFTDTSTNVVTGRLWEIFKLGVSVFTSTLQNPTTTLVDGTYTVRLTATGPGGSDSEEKLSYIAIAVAPPGPPPPPPPPPIPPAPPPLVEEEALVCLQWSNDGKTWSKERWLKAGKVGDYERRVRAHQLGSSAANGRIFRIRCYDPIEWELAGASIEIAQGR